MEEILSTLEKEGAGGANTLGDTVAPAYKTEAVQAKAHAYKCTTNLTAQMKEKFKEWSGLSIISPNPKLVDQATDHMESREMTNFLQLMALKKIPKNSKVLFLGSTAHEAFYIAKKRPDLRCRFQIDADGLKQEERLSSSLVKARSKLADPLLGPLALEFTNPLGVTHTPHFSFCGIKDLIRFSYDVIVAIDSILYIDPKDLRELVCKMEYDGHAPVVYATMHHCLEAITIDRDIEHPDAPWTWTINEPYMYMSITNSQAPPYKHLYAYCKQYWTCQHEMVTDVIFDKWGYGLFKFSLASKTQHVVKPLRSMPHYMAFIDPFAFYMYGKKEYYIIEKKHEASCRSYAFQRDEPDKPINWKQNIQFVRATGTKFLMLGKVAIGEWRKAGVPDIVIVAHIITQLSFDRKFQKNISRALAALAKEDFDIGFLHRWFSWPWNRFKTYINKLLKMNYLEISDKLVDFNIPAGVHYINSADRIGYLVSDVLTHVEFMLIGGSDPRDTPDRYKAFIATLDLPSYQPAECDSHFAGKIIPMYAKPVRKLWYFGARPGRSLPELKKVSKDIVISLKRDCLSVDPIHFDKYVPIKGFSFDLGLSPCDVPRGADVLYDVSCCNGTHDDTYCPNPAERLKTMVKLYFRREWNSLIVKYNSPLAHTIRSFLDRLPPTNVLRPNFSNPASYEVYFEFRRNWIGMHKSCSKWWEKFIGCLTDPYKLQMCYFDYLERFPMPAPAIPTTSLTAPTITPSAPPVTPTVVTPASVRKDTVMPSVAESDDEPEATDMQSRLDALLAPNHDELMQIKPAEGLDIIDMDTTEHELSAPMAPNPIPALGIRSLGTAYAAAEAANKLNEAIESDDDLEDNSPVSFVGGTHGDPAIAIPFDCFYKLLAFVVCGDVKKADWLKTFDKSKDAAKFCAALGYRLVCDDLAPYLPYGRTINVTITEGHWGLLTWQTDFFDQDKDRRPPDVDTHHLVQFDASGFCVYLAISYHLGDYGKIESLMATYGDTWPLKPVVTLEKTKRLFKKHGMKFVMKGEPFPECDFYYIHDCHVDYYVYRKTSKWKLPEEVDWKAIAYEFDLSKILKSNSWEDYMIALSASIETNDPKFMRCHKAAQAFLDSIKFANDNKPPKFPTAFFQGGPGCSKTDTAMLTLLNRPLVKGKIKQSEGCVVIAQSKDAALQLVARLCRYYTDKVGYEVNRHMLGRYFSTWVKTYAAALNNHGRECYTLFMNIKYVFVDECFTHITTYIGALSIAFPDAVIVNLGDVFQMGIDPDNYWDMTTNVGEYYLSQVRTIIVKESPKSIITGNLCFRYGPQFVKMSNAIIPENELTARFARTNRILHLDVRHMDALKRQGAPIMTPTIKKADNPAALEGLFTIRQKQGFSTDIMYIYLDEKQVGNLFASTSQLYVAMTRARQDVVILSTAGVYRVFMQQIRKVTKNKGVGGWIMPNIDVVDTYVPLAVHQPTLLEHGTLQKTKLPHWDTCLRDILDYNPTLPYGNMQASCVPAIQQANIRINPELQVGTDRTVKAISENTAGLTCWVSSHHQNLAAVAARQNVTELVAKRTKGFKANGAEISRNFYQAYIDSVNHESLLNESTFEYVMSASVNEYKQVAKITNHSLEQNSIGWLRRAMEHLKTQIKMKGIDVTFKGKAAKDSLFEIDDTATAGWGSLKVTPKNGQPIVEMEKLINHHWSPMFRFLTKMLKLSLKPHIVWANGLSEQEMWQKANQFIDWASEILQKDYVEMDASHIEKTNNLALIIFQLLIPNAGVFREFYRNVTNIRVVAATFMYWLKSQLASGRPDTLFINTFLQLIDLVIGGMAGPYGKNWWQHLNFLMIGGDDGTEQFDVKNVINYKAIEARLIAPLKIRKDTGCFEFFNWIFAEKGFYYNPLTLAWKVAGKHYTHVLSTDANFAEYIDSHKNLIYPYWHNFPQACKDMSNFFGVIPESIERLVLLLTGIVGLKKEHFEELAFEKQIADYLVGGVILPNKHTPHAMSADSGKNVSTTRPTSSIPTVSPYSLRVPNNDSLRNSITSNYSELLANLGFVLVSVSSAHHYTTPLASKLKSIDLELQLKWVARSLPDERLTGNGLTIERCLGDIFAQLVEIRDAKSKGELKNDDAWDQFVADFERMSPYSSYNDFIPLVEQLLDTWVPAQKINDLAKASPEPKFLNFMICFTNKIVYAVDWIPLQKPWVCCNCKEVTIPDKANNESLAGIKAFICRGCGIVIDDHRTCNWVMFEGEKIPMFGGKGKKRNNGTSINDPIKVEVEKKPQMKKKNKNKGKKAQIKNEVKAVAKVFKTAMRAPKKEISERPNAHGRIMKGYIAKEVRDDLRKNPQSSKAAKILAESIMRADARVTHRFKGKFGRKPTATGEPFSIRSVSMCPDNTEYGLDITLPTTDWMMFWNRNPLALTREYFWHNGKNFQYNIYGRSGDTDAIEAPALTWFDTFTSDAQSQWLWFVKAVVDTSPGNTVAPHGNTLYAGEFPDNPGSRSFPLTKNNKIAVAFNVGNTSTPAILSAQVWRFNQKKSALIQDIKVTCTNGVPGLISYTAADDGDYAINLIMNGLGSGGVVTLNYGDCIIANETTCLATWGVRCVPDLDNRLGSVDQMAVQASRVVLSNTTKIIDREGWIRMGYIDGGRHWRDYTGKGGVSEAFAHIPDQTPEGATRGASFAPKPEDEFFANPVDYFQTKDGLGIIDSYYPVSNDKPFYIMGFTMPDTDSRVFQISVFTEVVYSTMDSFEDTKLPWATKQQWDEALEILERVREFSANEDHVSDMAKQINKVARTVGSVMEIGEMVSSVFGG